MARKIVEDLSGKSVVLAGVGKMCELAALHLREAGASSITVANRTLSRAEELAAKCCGMAAEFERRCELIANADVVICSTDAPYSPGTATGRLKNSYQLRIGRSGTIRRLKMRTYGRFFHMCRKMEGSMRRV